MLSINLRYITTHSLIRISADNASPASWWVVCFLKTLNTVFQAFWAGAARGVLGAGPGGEQPGPRRRGRPLPRSPVARRGRAGPLARRGRGGGWGRGRPGQPGWDAGTGGRQPWVGAGPQAQGQARSGSGGRWGKARALRQTPEGDGGTRHPDETVQY